MTRPSSPAASSRRGSGASGESVAALDGKTYAVTPEMCVIADGSGRDRPGRRDGRRVHRLLARRPPRSSSRAPGSTRSAPPRPAATPASSPTPSTASPAASIRASWFPGLELATRLILELCGGEPSRGRAGRRGARAAAGDRLRSGLCRAARRPRPAAEARIRTILRSARLRRTRATQRAAADLAARRRGQGRPGRGGRAHRRLRRAAGRAAAADRRGRPAAC